mgnify:CR=1 FL=1
MTDRSFRTAPARNFNGGYAEHGPIIPMDKPGLFARLFRTPTERKDRHERCS